MKNIWNKLSRPGKTACDAQLHIVESYVGMRDR